MTYCDKRNQREKISTSQTHTDTTNKVIKLNCCATFFGLVKNKKSNAFLFTERQFFKLPIKQPYGQFFEYTYD